MLHLDIPHIDYVLIFYRYNCNDHSRLIYDLFISNCTIVAKYLLSGSAVGIAAITCILHLGFSIPSLIILL